MWPRNKNRQDRYQIRAGDVFRITKEGRRAGEQEIELFLVEHANEFVSAGFSGGIGYRGIVVSRSGENQPVGSGWRFAIVLERNVGRRYMNEGIEDGEAVRIAHFDDLVVGLKAIHAWGEQETDALEVPVPSGTSVLHAVAG